MGEGRSTTSEIYVYKYTYMHIHKYEDPRASPGLSLNSYSIKQTAPYHHHQHNGHCCCHGRKSQVYESAFAPSLRTRLFPMPLTFCYVLKERWLECCRAGQYNRLDLAVYRFVQEGLDTGLPAVQHKGK